MEQEKRILLDCRDAALGYEGKPVWEHLNFQVHSGDYVCIVGENGSGKLAKMSPPAPWVTV